jgi:hypothetical protein
VLQLIFRAQNKGKEFEERVLECHPGSAEVSSPSTGIQRDIYRYPGGPRQGGGGRRHPVFVSANSDAGERADAKGHTLAELADKDVNVVIPLATLRDLYAQSGGRIPSLDALKSGHTLGEFTGRNVRDGNGMAHTIYSQPEE